MDQSPFAPESDDESPPAGVAAADKSKSDSAADKKTPVEVKIDFDNISQRILAVDLPPLRQVDLQVGKAATLYASEIPPSCGQMGPPSLNVHRFDLAKRKSDVLLSGVNSFEISENGEKMLTRQGDKWLISSPRPLAAGGAGPPPDAQGVLKTEGIEVLVNPAAEWRQLPASNK